MECSERSLSAVIFNAQAHKQVQTNLTVVESSGGESIGGHQTRRPTAEGEPLKRSVRRAARTGRLRQAGRPQRTRCPRRLDTLVGATWRVTEGRVSPRLPDFFSVPSEPGSKYRILRVAILGASIPGGCVLGQADKAWEKAAACEAHAKSARDAAHKRMLERLRDSWIRIGNDAQFSVVVQRNAER
jgi:hypothetical protein